MSPCRREQLRCLRSHIQKRAILKQSLRASLGNCSRHGSTSCIPAVVHSRDIRSIHGRYHDEQARPSYRFSR